MDSSSKEQHGQKAEETPPFPVQYSSPCKIQVDFIISAINSHVGNPAPSHGALMPLPVISGQPCAHADRQCSPEEGAQQDGSQHAPTHTFPLHILCCWVPAHAISPSQSLVSSTATSISSHSHGPHPDFCHTSWGEAELGLQDQPRAPQVHAGALAHGPASNPRGSPTGRGEEDTDGQEMCYPPSLLPTFLLSHTTAPLAPLHHCQASIG